MSVLRGFGFTVSIPSMTTRSWYVDAEGVARWVADNGVINMDRLREHAEVRGQALSDAVSEVRARCTGGAA